MESILSGRAQIAKAVNATVITLDQAADGCRNFDAGAAQNFVIDPNGTVAAQSTG
jgi:glutathione-independent formaldehyde dehydrogenase